MTAPRELIHGGDVLTCKEQYPQRDFIDFSANINPLGLPPSVRKALEQSADACLSYPDQLCRVLKDALAEYEDVPASYILCGNGASDLIFRIAYGLRPKKALLMAPTFAEYENALGQVECEIVRHHLDAQGNFGINSDALALPKGTEMVFLCNPNNPTGSLIDPVLLLGTLAACKAMGAVLVVDECFLDFVESGEDYSLKAQLSRFYNLIILRAFTKIFAIPGLRLGYALCGNSALLAKIDAAGPPWSVSVPAQLCGIAAAEEKEFVAQTVALIAGERVYLSQGLAALGCQVFSACANYLLFYTPDVHLAENLLEAGIIIRDCSNFTALAPGYYRIAVRCRQENNALLGAIKEKLQCKQ